MLAEEHLKNLLHKKDFSNTEKVLLCLATQDRSVKAVKEIKEVGVSNGLRAVTKWNVSSLLSRSEGRAILTRNGWELTNDGCAFVSAVLETIESNPAPEVASSLRDHVPKIKNADVREFIEEGIECFERRLYRSAVTLTWVGAVALLHDHVLSNHLAAFNAEASRRDVKWRVAKTSDDLARMKEFDFLQIIEKLSIIGKNVKQELEKQLKLRNGCGHPNSLKISENIVAAHLEILILNVFTKFS